jgi:flagellar protein FlaI
MRRRRRFLERLQELGLTDYRRFTTMVNRYYADPERVMDRLDPDDREGESENRTSRRERAEAEAGLD